MNDPSHELAVSRAEVAIMTARLDALRAQLPAVDISLRRMARSLLTARRQSGRIRVTLHPELLLDADCSVFIVPWLIHQGKQGTTQHLRQYLTHVSRARTLRAVQTDENFLTAIPCLGATVDLMAHAAYVHQTWFPHVPMPQIRWARQPPRRRLRHMRFGCYRSRAPASIDISPRLDQPWIAQVFLHHVLHHEFCHHRQSVEHIPRREGVHSPRFRAWERAFPGYSDAMHWERLALPWLLEDQQPPWYTPPGNTTCNACPPPSLPPSSV